MSEPYQFKWIDQQDLEKSVTMLEESQGSLAKKVLQNKRGLDLLFLKQGCLCLALGEACCFYTNHSGAVRQNLNELRVRLKEREEERKAGQNRFESLFIWSPWLTILVTSLTGPLVLLFLGVMIGPCIINWLTRYV